VTDGPPRDWAEWHQPYDDPGSLLSGRLRRVQAHLRVLLGRQPPGPVALISLCAGQGRDVIGVLDGHPRRADVTARLVELDPRNVEYARRAAAAAGLGQVEVAEADAGQADAYAGAAPAGIVVACGIFGNISDADIAGTVAALPGLCAPGAGVIWTRHTRAPDLTPAIRGWLAAAGFAEEAFEAPAGTRQGIGRHRLAGPPAPFPAGQRLFTFAGFDPGAGPPGPAGAAG
jgi:hypothetical protein